MSQPLDNLPLWAVYPIVVVLMFVSVEVGYRYAKARSRRGVEGSDAGTGAIAGATLGVVAFLLAIAVGFGMNLNADRRALVMQDANAIRSTYLRAGYLVEPYRTDSRTLLKEYLDQHIAAAQPGQLEQAKARSEEIQAKLWAIAETVVLEVDKSDTISAYLDSLNETINVHWERVVKSLQVRIPPSILWAMLAISVLAMFLAGMQSGYAANRSIIGLVLMVLVFSVVLYLLIDMDRAQGGLIRVSQQPLLDLQQVLPTLP